MADSQASVILVPNDYEETPKAGQLYLKLQNPSFALALICRDIEGKLLPKPPAGVHPSSVIEPDAEVSPDASIGAFCYIGSGAKVGASVLESHVTIGRAAHIGDGAYLFSRVSVGDYCEIGERNRVMSGSVIGSDGYGYEYHNGSHQRVPQIGNVVTDAMLILVPTRRSTRPLWIDSIGAGTKIDNQVQIAHNVRVRRHCLVVAQVGISGVRS